MLKFSTNDQSGDPNPRPISPEVEQPFETTSERESTLGDLARAVSQLSQVRDETFHEFEKGSSLDPSSPAFNARKWAQSFIAAYNGTSPQPLSGVSFEALSVHGFGSDAVGNVPLQWLGAVRDLIGSNRKHKVEILKGVDGVLNDGEMLVVLGPPGSGCSTYLKTIAGEMNGIYLDENTKINYRGLTSEQMQGQFRGEAVYTAVVDVHFPKLTVGQTLQFAAEARAPREPPYGISRTEYARLMRDTVMAIFGISHTVNTKVGNDFIRGVSGGERKRVTISEVALSDAPLQCWDNSTRGLDSANAIEFCRNLRLSSDFFGTASAVAIYQAPQAAYDIFDKVSVLYQGEQIYFGSTSTAKQFFVNMGFECPDQQTTPDFLTSLTSPSERRARSGCKVPTTPREFASAWRQSEEYKRLKEEIRGFNAAHHPTERYDDFLALRRVKQSKFLRPKSPYTLSFPQQVQICLRRGFWRLFSDPGFTISQLVGNFVVALIIGSMFYNLQPVTSSFFLRGVVIFLAILFNAFGSALEMYTLYDQRLIVEKHSRYAFYHPSAEALASVITDLPYKITNAILFNTTLYLMTNLRREAGAYFFFLLFGFVILLTMSSFFRSIASVSRTLQQALAPATVLILGLVMFTGFALPPSYMRGWSRWMKFVNPMSYAFESLMINEFAGREFDCSTVIPRGPSYDVSGMQRACQIDGATPGSLIVQGGSYLSAAFEYNPAYKWRNLGILFAFFAAMSLVYFVAAEYVMSQKSKGEVLVFPRGAIPPELKAADEEARITDSPSVAPAAEALIQRQTAIFSWKDVVFDIKIKQETRRILDHVDGWVKPGTLTALMGVSGAGKTTLLDVLATRVTMGVVTGEMLVDGKQRDASFQRKTGYVQQQDLHLATSTVREALRFSAILRQPRHVSRQEKLDYVEHVLVLLEMERYADAVVGVPGEGLNVEQRKRLTIGIELVAKPELLLFLDEPTSGLDSQTSWNILLLLRKLTSHGQAILCTIHQPSASLFEQFDRLLFLAKGGRTTYFGPVGKGSRILIDYFERNGAVKYPAGENPAEWMFTAVGAAPGSSTNVDWHQAWLSSPERSEVRAELARLKSSEVNGGSDTSSTQSTNLSEFAAPFSQQLLAVTHRVFQQYWRTPSYILAKTGLVTVSGIFVGCAFYKMETSSRGVTNQMLSLFLLFLLFGQMMGQIMPNIVVQRSLYEARERPSKTYHWQCFVLSQIIVELPWGAVMATILYFTWYYPTGFYLNAIATNSVAIRGFTMWLFITVFMWFMSTFASVIIAGMHSAEMAGEAANLLFTVSLLFCGALIPGSQLPRFWIFMYRLSPLTYLTEGMLSTAVKDTAIVCLDSDFINVAPPSGQTCAQYLGPWIASSGGYLAAGTESSTSACRLCPMDNTNQFLASLEMDPGNVWRDFSVMWAFIVFNIVATIGIYWLARVPKKAGREKGGEKKEA